ASSSRWTATRGWCGWSDAGRGRCHGGSAGRGVAPAPGWAPSSRRPRRGCFPPPGDRPRGPFSPGGATRRLLGVSVQDTDVSASRGGELPPVPPGASAQRPNGEGPTARAAAAVLLVHDLIIHQGTAYVLPEGLLAAAHLLGVRTIAVELMQAPTPANGRAAV